MHHHLVQLSPVLQFDLWTSGTAPPSPSVSMQIFDFSLTEDHMSALKGLNRGWRACSIDE